MREDFAAAATDRWRDSHVLQAKARWTGAIYFARFSLECQIKQILDRAGKRQLPRQFRTHNLVFLAKQARAQPLPNPIVADLQEIDSVEVAIRYNVRSFSRKEAKRLLGMVSLLRRWFREKGYSDVQVKVEPVGVDNLVAVFFVSVFFQGKDWGERNDAVKAILARHLSRKMLETISYYLVLTPEEWVRDKAFAG